MRERQLSVCQSIRRDTLAPALRMSLIALLFTTLGLVNAYAKGDVRLTNLAPLPVSGTVTDQNGSPLIGVSVTLKGSTSVGTVTSANGSYSLTIPDGNGTLVFSYVGYVSQEVPVQGRARVDVTLENSISAHSQVVVVGYGTQKKSDLTGSISSLDTKDIQGQAISNVEQALQGKIAGVQVHYNSGEPGAPMQVQIRGIGTFGNADPLYVVDGIPMKAQDMSTINPNNIQSLEVLKDASAAAIYGSRASNGVVLITTKTGQRGDMRLDYNGYVGIQSFTDFIPMLNSQQYADVVNESSVASGYPLEPAYNDPENLKHSTDWQKEAYRTAPMTNHNVSISGGSDKAIYAITGNYLSQDGIMVFNYLKRYSASINTRFNVSKKLTVGEMISLSRTKGLNRHQGNNLAFTYLLGASPTMRVYNPDNEGGYDGPNPKETGINNRDNIIERRDMRRVYDYANRVIANFYAEYEFIPGLKDKVSYGLNAHLDEQKAFTPTFEAGNRTNRIASLSNRDTKAAHTLLQNILTYDKKFGNVLSMSLLGGVSQETDVQTRLSGSIQEFPSNELQVIDAGTGTFNVGGNKSEYSLRSYFTRANLTFYDKYLFTGTFRRDGSSRFGKQNRYGNFPSLALGWLMSRENFMKDIKPITQLKIRASWGKLGNQDIGNYVNQTTVSTTPRYILGDDIAPAAAPTELGNPALKWETTVQSDIGFDLSMFNDQLAISADYFIKNTKDILLRVPISAATGIQRDNGPYQNAAGMKNTGFEFAATYTKTVSNNFSYQISGNISTVKNKVTSLGGESSIINRVENAYFYGAYTYTAIGLPISSYYGYIAEGIFQDASDIASHATQPRAEPGDVKFKDVDGNGIVDANDRVILGSPFPDFVYGVSANIKFVGFDLGVSLHGVQGREVYNSQLAFLESVNGEHNQRIEVLNRWHGKGTSNSIPRAVRDNPNDNTRSSTRFLEDASYLRLENMQLGYTIPDQLTSRIGIRNLRFYINAQNLFTLTKYSGYNPDVRGGAGYDEVSGDPLSIGVDNGSYPLPKVLQFGVQVGF